MHRSGVFDLKLHGGKAPPWLVRRMKKLAKSIIQIIISEFGVNNFLERLADPLWFQAFSYVLGYDWDSSGVTTVTTGVIKSVLSEEFGVLGAGGKGSRSLKTLDEIESIGRVFDFDEEKISELKRASKLAAKVDNAVLQDNHSLYHHTMFISERGDWVIIQQGMFPKLKSARRYHWYSSKLKSFVIDPHKIIGTLKLPFVLNMASKDSTEAQKVSVDLIKEGVNQIRKDYGLLLALTKKTRPLETFFGCTNTRIPKMDTLHISIIPMRIDWRVLEKAYEVQPDSYEELIELRGLGPGLIRALALIAELIYDAKVSWFDPLRYTYAHGGKDGIPYPVNIKRMEKSIRFLEDIIEDIKLNKKEKARILQKLARLLPR